MQDPISGDVSPALGQGSPSGQGTSAVAYSTKLHNTASNQSGKFYEEYTPGLQQNSPPFAVAVSIRGREGGATAEIGGECCPAVRASQGGGDKPHVMERMMVRRLMPVECERLQGFEDGWTAWGVDDHGRRVEMKDGPRYKMLGNAVTDDVADWFGQRITAVDAGEKLGAAS